MKRTLRTISFLSVFFYYGCSAQKNISQTPIPTYSITYKLITNAEYEHLDASYLDRTNKGILKKDIKQKQVVIPIGVVSKGYVASISSTGFGAKDSLATIELQIFRDDSLVVDKVVMGANPSLAVSYAVE